MYKNGLQAVLTHSVDIFLDLKTISTCFVLFFFSLNLQYCFKVTDFKTLKLCDLRGLGSHLGCGCRMVSIRAGEPWVPKKMGKGVREEAGDRNKDHFK